MTVIEAQDLCKNYGTRQAVSALDLRVDAGEMVALVGENGAGKTTALALLSGQLVPDRGQARIGGHDVFGQPLQARQLLGYVSQDLPPPSHLTIDEMAEFVCQVKGQPLDQPQLQRLLRLSGLDQDANRLIGELSHGMQRKTSWVMALIANPQALLIDEGLAGLDAASRDALVAETANRLNRGAGVLWTEHDLTPVVSQLARVVVLHRGRLHARVSGDEIRQIAATGQLAAQMAAWTRGDAHLDPGG